MPRLTPSSLDTHQAGRLDVIDRRSFLLALGQTGLFAALVGRLGFLQIVEGERYRTLAEDNRINVKILPPPRGLIVDRFGVPLALNRQDYTVWITPEQTPSLSETLRQISRFIILPEGAVDTVLKTAKTQPRFIPVLIRGGLSWEDVTRLEVNIADLPGTSIVDGLIRSYPIAEATAHLIGYVGTPGPETKGQDPLFAVPGFKIGRTGIEQLRDTGLRGRSGHAELEVNVKGRAVQEITRRPSLPGKRLTLTIDADLQSVTYERLSKERSASAVLMDAVTGDLYAMASYPSYDPNRFTNGIPASEWAELSNDPAHPLINKSIAGQYPPGSTFKMMTALAGLKGGHITPNSRVFCPGHFRLGSTVFHCWKKGGHGSVNVVDAIAESCDTFFYDLSLKMGIDALAAMARRFGMDEKSTLGLMEEKKGLIPDPAWKERARKAKWLTGETVVAAIGQGYVLTTPLQLAVMTARLVNGGLAVQPRLFADDDLVTPSPLGLAAEHLALIKEGMDQVVNSPRGTAIRSKIADPCCSMGGKTGTSQVRRITAAERAAGVRNENLPWHHRHHALFVGYGPVINPRYVCAVVVEHGVGGSKAAAPIAHDLLLAAQRRNPADIRLKPTDSIQEG